MFIWLYSYSFDTFLEKILDTAIDSRACQATLLVVEDGSWFTPAEPVLGRKHEGVLVSSSIQSNSVLDRAVPCSPDRIRVLVAESNRMASQLIEGAFQKHRQKFEVHTCSGGSAETLQELAKKEPHVAVVSSDLLDGPLTGFKVLHQLRDANSRICTVMLLNSSERELVIDSFRSGARGVFTRAHSIAALPKCIRVVHQGQVWVNNDQIELLLELIMRLRPLQTVTPGGKPVLTRRE
jgi:DNA-binding NarL/FixJ family response regulator